jgi:hypothetical protein
MIGSSRYRQKKSEETDFDRDMGDVIKLENIKNIISPQGKSSNEED